MRHQQALELAPNSHNPEVIGANPTPAIMDEKKPRSALFAFSTSHAAYFHYSVRCRTTVSVRGSTNKYEQIVVNRPFHGKRGFTLRLDRSIGVNFRGYVDRGMSQKLLSEFKIARLCVDQARSRVTEVRLRTTVSGVTMTRDYFQADQIRRTITPKNLSKSPRLG